MNEKFPYMGDQREDLYASRQRPEEERMSEGEIALSPGEQRRKIEEAYEARNRLEGAQIRLGIGGEKEVGAEAHSEDSLQRIEEYKAALVTATQGRIFGDSYLMHRLLRNVSEDPKLDTVAAEKAALMTQITEKISESGRTTRDFYDK